MFFTITTEADVQFTWQRIRDVGNPSMDTKPHGKLPVVLTIGQVDHEFAMAKHEVAVEHYVAFLNAKATTHDPYGLYNPDSTTDDLGYVLRYGEGTVESPYYYRAKPGKERFPINFISWYDAARFVNWLANGQGDGDTENGVYDMNLEEPTRLPGAPVFIPNGDEWQKAAHYDPRTSAEGGPAMDKHYWMYPQMTNDRPIRAILDAQGNITNPQPYLSHYDNESRRDGHCKVDSGSDGTGSYYGVMHMGGNVVEWIEDRDGVPEPLHQQIRGGDLENGSGDQRNHFVNIAPIDWESTDNGLRLAATIAYAFDAHDEPVVFIEPLDHEAFEPSDPASFRIGLTDHAVAPAGGLSVHFDIYGQAIEGEDFDPLGDSVLIPENTSETVLTVMPKADLIDNELPESVEVRLTATTDPSIDIAPSPHNSATTYLLGPLSAGSYEAWIYDRFPRDVLADSALQAAVWGATANPDGDALGNLQEFFHGTDMQIAEETDPYSSAISFLPEGLDIEISFSRRKGITGISYFVDSSTSLQSWEYVGKLPESTQSVDDNTELVTLS